MCMTQIPGTNEEPKTVLELDELVTLLETEVERIKYNRIDTIFPDTGPYRRELYQAHIKFINASRQYSQLAFIAANRTGKTLTGAYIMTCHLTGIYPSWWQGRRFLNAIQAWCAGKTNQKTKEILQAELLGDEMDFGTGMIPKHLIVGRPTKKQGSTNCVEIVKVRHVSGGVSVLTFKSYEQGRGGFEGTKIQVIWLDEEPEDESIYSECLIRTADEHKPGMIYCTFTPLYGLKGVALLFLPDLFATRDGSVRTDIYKFAVQTTWDDVPHLSKQMKDELYAGCLPHEREARSKGIPSLGSGAIFPIVWDTVTIDPLPFPIPPWWPKVYGFDTGWKCNAAVWLTQNPDDNILYAYAEYYAGQEHVAIHTHAIKQRGDWITGAADAFAVNQQDGAKMIDLYRAEGLNLVNAKKTDRDSGILKIQQLFDSGQLKIFSTCVNLLRELRRYQRDEKGQIVKKDDHAVDAFRYAVATGLDWLETPPDDHPHNDFYDDIGQRDRHTGY